MTDTIFAFGTSEARSAIAVLRASGSICKEILVQLCGVLPPARRATLCIVRNPFSGGELDQALVLWFPGPASFTGEDCFELHLHGGRAVRRAVTDVMVQFSGCRIARPGEFTHRAFNNGKMDLTELEGLGDLIDANTELQRRQALGEYRGKLAVKAGMWRNALLECMGLFEAYLDFAEEGDAPKEVVTEIRTRIEALLEELVSAIKNANAGEMVRGGARVVLAGPPNAGKSSLLNAIALRDVAIVSDIPGTTRDVLEVRVELAGLEVIFCDTAGLREPGDEIEALGIERAQRSLERADLVVWLIPSGGEIVQCPAATSAHSISILSKSDLYNNESYETGMDLLRVSTRTGEGVEQLLELIASRLLADAGSVEDVVLTNSRQVECVKACVAALKGFGLTMAVQPEVLVEDLRYAARCLDELIGSVSVDQVLDVVFSRFCMGK